MFTKEMLEKYANDLLFDLTDDELDLLLSEFDVINSKMEIIANMEGIKDVEPLSFPQDIKTTSLRKDEDVEVIPYEDVLKNCDDKIEDVAVVPKVVG